MLPEFSSLIKYIAALVFILPITGMAACSQSAANVALPTVPATPSPVASGFFSGPVDYVIYQDGNMFKAVNGSAGTIDYSGVDPKQVTQMAIDTLKQGTVWLKDMARPQGLVMKDYVTVIASYNGQMLFYGNFGHTPYQPNEQRVMVFNAETETSKPILEWRDYLGNKVAWIVAHYKLDPQTIHQHLSFETAKSDNTTIITRLEITYGQDVATVSVDNSNFVVANGTATLKGPTEIKSTLKVEGSLSMAYGAGSGASNQLGSGNCIFAADASNNPVTVNLPSGKGSEGRIYIIKKVDTTASTVTIVPSGSDTVDGAARYILSTAYKYVTLVSNGNGWYIIGGN